VRIVDFKNPESEIQGPKLIVTVEKLKDVIAPFNLCEQACGLWLLAYQGV